ncbi:apolipoprotein L3-like [Erpetoichthys calabaricus]|uniref:apolipoprotein L3-like n=1 Tax=Erpetoichthys calabaricus TaxID=27687 RepID=UPI00223491E8|nr:apolipoprotein L3-like [Erpetoichthys calabaricus]
MQKTFKIILKLFNDHVKGLQTNIDDLRCIADKLDSFHKKATIAKITGGSVSVAGGVVTIIGLILTPFTLGASLVVTGVGLGVAMAGGVTNASATISDTVNNSVDRKKVEEIIESFQKNINVFEEPLEDVKNFTNKIELLNTCKLEDLMNKWNKAQLGARAGKMFTSFADISRLALLANLSGGVAKAIRVAGAATGVISGLFLGLDLLFIVKDSIDLHKGAKNEFAAKIRQAADEMQCALQELNEFCIKLPTIQNP